MGLSTLGQREWASPTDDEAPTHLKPIHPRDFGYEQARHLLLRAGFGGTPSQIQTLAGWGPEKAVDYLLNYESIPEDAGREDAFDKDIMRPPTRAEQEAYRAAQRAQDENALAQFRLRRQQAQRQDRQQMGEVQRWWLEKMIESPRPFQEKMVLFWHGHFATSYRTIENSYHMLKQNELFRAHAAGNFGELLFQIIRDPAMLAYLDNNDSSKREPNENLARELMELFSLGEGAYSERDIKEGARALTGYTFEDDEFVFNEENHDSGSKRILGASGAMDGDDFCRAILGQRACPEFIASKLYRFFARYVPTNPRDQDQDTRTIVRQLASTMIKAKYELRPVMRQLFLSEHFYHPSVVGEKIKSPTELVVGAVRSLNTPVRDLAILNDALNLMGQSLFYPPSVKGWDGGRAWINTSTMFVRQNILAFLLTGKKPVGYDALADENKYDPTPLLDALEKGDPGASSDPGKVVDYMLRLTLGRAPQHAHDTLTKFVDEHGGVRPPVVTGALLLVTAMPEYQLC
ncbi:MAG: DUF1800 domain-containing protein [Phycisphaerales bacterium]